MQNQSFSRSFAESLAQALFTRHPHAGMCLLFVGVIQAQQEQFNAYAAGPLLRPETAATANGDSGRGQRMADKLCMVGSADAGLAAVQLGGMSAFPEKCSDSWPSANASQEIFTLQSATLPSEVPSTLPIEVRAILILY